MGGPTRRPGPRRARRLARLPGLLLALGLAAGACARLPSSYPLPPAPAVDAAPIAADAAWLADDAREGRGLGTRGLADAADYLAARFREIGLQPAFPAASGAPGSGYLQGFEVPVDLRIERALLGVPDVPLVRGADYEAFVSSADGDVSAELVFAGYGISDGAAGWDDYAGLDLEGKVAVVLDDRPEVRALKPGHPGGPRHGTGGDAPPSALSAHLGRAYKLLNARRRGAAAVLLVPSDPGARGLAGGAGDEPANPTEPGGDAVGLGLSRDAGERILAAAGLDLAALQAEMEVRGAPVSRPLGVDARVVVDVERERGEIDNVVGVLRGAERPEEAVVVGAHYDHLGYGAFGSLTPDRRGEVYHGADDNASGTAAVLAVARALAAGPAPRRSVVFTAFTGEEAGLLGSAHFVAHPPPGIQKMVAMLNLDMVGRLEGDLLTVYGIETSPVWEGLLERAADPLGFRTQLVRDGIGPSDHTSFAVEGVPALLFFTGVHDQYHTPDDRAALLNDAGIARIAELVYRVAWALADARVTPPAVAVTAPDTTTGGRGYGVYLGTIPAFGGEPVDGVRIQGVRRDSPAEEAGLRGGDVIVGFGGVEVSNLEEFAAMLFRASPGDEVEIVVLRDGERVTTRATLGARR